MGTFAPYTEPRLCNTIGLPAVFMLSNSGPRWLKTPALVVAKHDNKMQRRRERTMKYMPRASNRIDPWKSMQLDMLSYVTYGIIKCHCFDIQ